MARVFQVCVGTTLVLLAIVGPVVYALYYQAQMRNFRVVSPGILYRSGQMTPAGLKRIFHDYGIKTVISLRDSKTEEERAEEALCNSEEVTFVRIPPSCWGDVGGVVPVEAGVRTFKEIMADPRNYPVLVHCFAGIHRTGAYTAIYRMEFEHWNNDRAMDEMRACGYTTLDEEVDILTYMEQYRPAWRASPAGAAGMPAARKPRRHRVLRPHTTTNGSLEAATPPREVRGSRAVLKKPAASRSGEGKTRSPHARPGATGPGDVAGRHGPGGG
jgi:protein tyrosine phosphatase (PTP) superfamily phosphohydrolase (DUF442 family)